MDYSEIKNTKEFKGDENQCTVIASSVAFDIPYPKMHEFYAQNGRKKGKGLSGCKTNEMIVKVAKINGYKVPRYGIMKKYSYGGNSRKFAGCKYVQYIPNEGFHGEILVKSKHQLTVNNFRNYLPRGNYIFGIREHVLAVQNGAVHDWTENRKHKITRIWTVEKIGKKLRPNKKAKYDFSSFV